MKDSRGFTRRHMASRPAVRMPLYGGGGLLLIVALVAHSPVLLGIVKQVARAVANQKLSAKVLLLPTRSRVVWIGHFISAIPSHTFELSNSRAYAQDSQKGLYTRTHWLPKGP